ncbi:hypothetical protein Rahaq_3996 [Rahnella aceris]|jgi:hypothetical protein|uniref:Uncharacterized protein n=1 Tax=Rahnella sp. (strain Y9602) TaxID=2703885 RepID=A0A0H3FHA3_RAHSY|nr:hypothetical protein Rahaq_3996 [Rahnella aceris]
MAALLKNEKISVSHMQKPLHCFTKDREHFGFSPAVIA